MDTKERVVISLGGSLIVPEEVDVTFLSAFRNLILSYVDRGFSFAIVTGGGRTCRKYQAAAREAVPGISQADLDWIGLNMNTYHAKFLRHLLGNVASETVVVDYSKPLPTDAPVILIGAEAPGHSSDFDAVIVAEKYRATRLVNLSNIDYVYTADPRKDANAQKIEKINWSDFRKLLPSEFSPGLSSPFDPVAAKKAEELSLEVAVINGARLPEFEKYLSGEPFIGTVIS